MLHPDVEQWIDENPREGFAFNNMPDSYPVKQLIINSILKGSIPQILLLELNYFMNAYEHYRKVGVDCSEELESSKGLRRPYDLKIVAWNLYRKNQEKLFRVDFTTPHGWSGYFDTNNPSVLSRLKQDTVVTIIGEIESVVTPYYVVLGGKIGVSK